MSNTDTFIDEVSEELRRDRLYRLFRKWAWVVVLVVLFIVGGTAWREWASGQNTKQARELGDNILKLLQIEDPISRQKSLQSLDTENPDVSAIAYLLAANTLIENDLPDQGITLLDKVGNDLQVSVVYRDLAILKSVMLTENRAEYEIVLTRIEPLTAYDRPFRLIALEYKAHILLDIGTESSAQWDEAIQILNGILQDPDLSNLQEERVRAMLTIIGQ